MKWFRRLLALLAGLLVCALLVAGAVLLLDDSAHKRLLIWSAEHFLDSQLVIDGPIRIDITRNLLLESGDILLTANDNSYRLAVGKLQANFRLGSYLRTGTFWFNSLDLTDVNLELAETPGDGVALEDLYFPPVVIGQASINNLVFAYRELHPGTLHTIALDALTIKELGEDQPVELRATGQFEGQPFVLQGTTGSIAQLVERSEPHRVQLELSSAPVNIQLQGTIADPVNGRGLDLQIQADVLQVSDIIEIVRDAIPPLGSLQGTLTLRGDYDAPRLEVIDLHLQREQEVDLTVRGSVDDALTVAGLDLHLDGQSSNPQVLSWLLFGKHDRMQSLQVTGSVRGDAARLSLHELDASAETSDGLKLQLNGSTIIHPAGHRLTQADAGLAMQFSAPTLAAANLFGLENIPEPGPISGTLALALGRDALGIYDTDIGIGSRKDTRIQLKGDVGYLQLHDEPDLSGIKLQTDIQTTELARLGEQLDYELPAFGPARLRGKLVSRDSELRLQGARLDIGTPGESTLEATGLLATQLDDPARIQVAMDVAIGAAEFSRLVAPLGYTLPELGPTRITGRLENRKSELLFSDVRVEVGADDQPSIRANGSVTTQLQKGSTIKVALDVAVTDLIAAFRGKLPGYLGRLEGKAEISDLDGEWGIESFKLASTQTSLYQLNLSGRYDDLVHYDAATINANLVIDSLERLGETIDLNLGGMGAYSMQGRLTADKGRWRYKGGATLGATSSTSEITGRLQDGKPVFTGSLEIPVLYLADLGMGQKVKHVPDELNARDSSDSPHVFSRNPLDIEFLNNLDFDLALSIDEVESGELAIDSVKGRLLLHNGHLTVAPLRLIFEGGDTDINLEVKSLETPEYRLAIISDDVKLGPLLAQIQDEVPIQGYSNIYLDLNTRGHTAHDMASNLTGSLNLGLENARIPRRDVEFLSVDVFGWVVSRTVSREEQFLNLNCLVMAFAVNEGKVKSETLIAEGPRLSLNGQINLDLGAETLDIVLIPKQKKRIFSSASPVKVNGPMKDPNVEAIPARAALKEIGTMTMLPAVIIPVRAAEKLWSLLGDGDQVGNGCANIDEVRAAVK